MYLLHVYIQYSEHKHCLTTDNNVNIRLLIIKYK